MNYRTNRSKSRRTNKQAESSINPQSLIKKAEGKEVKPYVAERTFSGFNLHPQLHKNIEFKGYTSPTAIQDQSIESLIEGKNLIGIANTGTGKTGAFLIPIIQNLLLDQNSRALVIVPTRELACQIEQEFKSLSHKTNLTSACFIGGTSVGKDERIARRGSHLIVGTPGRLTDLMDRKALRIDRTPILVLDEFDRMLDMGFVKPIKAILNAMKSRKQTMLFSATIDNSQQQLINQIVSKAVKVNVSQGTQSSDNVNQDIIRVGASEDRFDLLLNLLRKPNFDKVILFAETKRVVDKLGKQLNRAGLTSDVIHGNKSQNYRIKAINHFKAGKVKVLVATDVAARGIDISGVTHVINYQLPKTMDSYIHRIGRTGRANTTGTAYTFV